MLNVHTATTVVIAMVICMLTSMVFAPAWNVIVDIVIRQMRVIHPTPSGWTDTTNGRNKQFSVQDYADKYKGY